MMRKILCCLFAAIGFVSSNAQGPNANAAEEATKNIVFIAGVPSHGYGSHEHLAGSRLLAHTITERGFGANCTVIADGWPKDDSVLDKANTIVIYSDGGGSHPALAHLDRLGALMDKGVGLVCLHYAVEVPKERGGAEFKKWLGGYFETNWSVNPHWKANYKTLPSHPITAGVPPFAANDEWYFHMRFTDDSSRLTPILSDVPPESTMSRPDGSHSGNPDVRKAVAKHEPQHTAWVYVRENGGRSFGFTGGHYHWNWGRPEVSQLVTNAIVWTAGIDPATGKNPSQYVSVAELADGQDENKPGDFNAEQIHNDFSIPLKLVALNGTTEGQADKDKKVKPAYQSVIVNSTTSGHQVDISIPVTGAKKIFLVTNDAGDGFACDWADWVKPEFIDAKGNRTSLVGLKMGRAESQWGRVNLNRNAAGGPLKIRGKEFDKGIGTHANSVVEFDVPPGSVTFEANAGLDIGGTSQNEGKSSSVQFVIYLDSVPKDLNAPGIPASEQRKPENAVTGLDTHDGVVAQLAASEPQLKSLTNIDIDHRGRVWACEVVNYRQHKNDRTEGDRILILEDTNHDGVMDNSKVFYQGRDIDSALGICILGNRVLVSAAPYIIEFIDENGDDVPDRKNYAFTKTGDPQHDHSVHSFVYGPDNRLYFNYGNTGHRLCDKDGNPILDPWGRAINDSGKPYRQGMAFRCNLDFSHMEVLGNNFRNNYELAVDSFGTVWQSDNDDDGNRGTRINYVMEYGNFGYTDEMNGDSWQKPRTNMEQEIPQRHWHLNDPGVVPTLIITGAGSPTGIMVYEGSLLPEPFRNQVIHCDAGPNVVRAYPVTNSGAGYSATILNLVEGSRDKWFRPADTCVAPDGSVFISDWYDPGVGGHLMEDTERGRLFRVAPANAQYNVPTNDFTTPAGAVAALQSPNQSVRYLASQALIKFGAKAEKELSASFSSNDARQAARALWILAGIDGVGQKYIEQALKHKNSDIRITGIRAARANKVSRDKFIDPLLQDSNPQVRRELCVALREDDSPEMPKRWVALAGQYDGKDRWMLEALGIAAMDRWDECLDAYLKNHPTHDLAGTQIIWRSRANKSAELIAGKLKDANATADQIDPMLRALDFQKPENRQLALRGLIRDPIGNASLQDRIVTEAVMRLDNPSEAIADQKVAASIKKYVHSLGTSAAILPIIEKLGINDMDKSILASAVEAENLTAGVKAVDLALGKGDGKNVEQAVLVAETEADQQKKVLAQRLAKLVALSGNARAAQIMRNALEQPNIDSSVRIAAAMGLARKVEGQKVLIELAEAKKLPADAATMVASLLRQSKDGGVAKKANELFPAPATSNRPLAPIDQLAELRGDAQSGKKLFGSIATCAQCHIVNNEGKNVGPDLSEIGDKLTREAMYVAVINPSAGISHNYENYSALTEDGEVISGLLISKNDTELILKDKDGIERKLPMAKVEEFKKLETSIMPANLVELTDQQGLVDIVEFMTTLKKKK